MITDLLSKDGYEEGLKYLQYLKQEITLLHIMAPQELEPEVSGSLRLTDVEDQEIRDITVTPQVLKAYKRTVDEFLNSLRDFCYTRGINYVLTSSAASIEQVIFTNLTRLGFVR